jgi:hypothetical protein
MAQSILVCIIGAEISDETFESFAFTLSGALGCLE